jgi:sigma-B regulation protein RsbU (phosphoserine phosphatase)
MMDIVGITIEGAEGRTPARVRLRSCTTVGRDEDNDISIRDTMLSRHHAEIRERNGQFYVVDLGSRNGTYVNNDRIRGERLLGDGDVVALGGTSLVFHATEIPGPDETASHGVVSAEITDEATTSTVQRVVDVAELGREDRALGVVCQATNALVAHHPLPKLFDKVLEAILDAVPGRRAAIMLLEGQPPMPKLKATRSRDGVDMGVIRPDIVQRALEGREAFLVCDIVVDADWREGTTMDIDPMRSVMCAPLWSTSNGKGDGRVLGMVYLESQSGGPPLTDRDLHIFVMLANMTATKIENSRLLEESLQKQLLEEDMRLAAEIQADLLPRSSPLLQGYRICGKTEPCRMVGGDYFDFEHDGQSLHIALADVAGKGIGAAMLMVALRATVRAHWRDGGLTEAMARVNRTFHQTVPADRYATFFMARLDPPSGRLEYVNAGHNRPLLVRPDGSWQRLEVAGTVVGAFPEATYEQEVVVLDPGACLLVFSDGISDAWHDQDEADRQLAKLVLARRRGEVADLRAEIFRAVDQANDDRTLIILERL